MNITAEKKCLYTRVLSVSLTFLLFISLDMSAHKKSISYLQIRASESSTKDTGSTCCIFTALERRPQTQFTFVRFPTGFFSHPLSFALIPNRFLSFRLSLFFLPFCHLLLPCIAAGNAYKFSSRAGFSAQPHLLQPIQQSAAIKGHEGDESSPGNKLRHRHRHCHLFYQTVPRSKIAEPSASPMKDEQEVLQPKGHRNLCSSGEE